MARWRATTTGTRDSDLPTRRRRTTLIALPRERRFDAADVAVIVDEDVDGDVAEAREVAGERLGLVAAELEQEPAAAPQEARRVGKDAPQDLGAVAPPS